MDQTNPMYFKTRRIWFRFMNFPQKFKNKREIGFEIWKGPAREKDP